MCEKGSWCKLQIIEKDLKKLADHKKSDYNIYKPWKDWQISQVMVMLAFLQNGNMKQAFSGRFKFYSSFPVLLVTLVGSYANLKVLMIDMKWVASIYFTTKTFDTL